MPARLEWSGRALADLGRLDAFLRANNPRAAETAIDTILGEIAHLLDFPLSGRSLSDDDDDIRRELIVSFSGSGYLVLYVFEDDTVTIVRVRHMREAGY